jgi:hypothetical protein
MTFGHPDLVEPSASAGEMDFSPAEKRFRKNGL